MRSWLTLVAVVLLFGLFGCGDGADDSGGVSDSTVSIDDCVADLMADDAPTRRAACVAIGNADRRAAARSIPLLVWALHDDDPGVRTASAEALFAIGDAAVEDATRFVVEGSERGEALKFQDMRVRLGPGLRPHDVAVVLSNRQPDVRLAGTFGVLAFVRPGHDFCSSGLVVELLLERLDDPEEGPRRMAATVLGIGGLVAAADRFGRTPSKLEALQELTGSEDETTRRLAGVLVGCLSPSEAPAADAAEAERLVRELVEAYETSPTARRGAVAGLARLGPAAASSVPFLIRVLEGSDRGDHESGAIAQKVTQLGPNYVDPRISKRSAAFALARIGAPAAAARDALKALVDAPDERLRYIVRLALRRIGE